MEYVDRQTNFLSKNAYGYKNLGTRNDIQKAMKDVISLSLNFHLVELKSLLIEFYLNMLRKNFNFCCSNSIKNYSIFIIHSNWSLKIGMYLSLSVEFNHIMFEHSN